MPTLWNQNRKGWYWQLPENVEENEKATIQWDKPIHAYKEINANMPDIVDTDRQEKCVLVDILIPTDDNVSIK